MTPFEKGTRNPKPAADMDRKSLSALLDSSPTDALAYLLSRQDGPAQFLAAGGARCSKVTLRELWREFASPDADSPTLFELLAGKGRPRRWLVWAERIRADGTEQSQSFLTSLVSCMRLRLKGARSDAKRSLLQVMLLRGVGGLVLVAGLFWLTYETVGGAGGVHVKIMSTLAVVALVNLVYGMWFFVIVRAQAVRLALDLRALSRAGISEDEIADS